MKTNGNHYKCLLCISKVSTEVCPRSGKHHKLNIISEPSYKDVFISLKVYDSPSSTREKLSDLCALLIIPT
ncbi:Rqc2 like RqcH [Dissostichus eleginoides]|uniref:Rqc2 like RqcH n=1 Tax=Dissostichus eleginoides TaxID=100907 RepID=A0AAD9F4K3_DISEL|nr:Rqc2 like RqcH [Dissostichus eleginoides]